MPKVELPETGEVIEDRRRKFRRSEDIELSPLGTTQAAAWAVVGGLVVLYLLLVAIGAIKPGTAKALSIVVLVMAIVWLAHAWRRLYAGGFSARTDRERRGF
jgi:ABC-type transport system involved in cytochrome bd biosynthesis fused ATPase/permease subunit